MCALVALPAGVGLFVLGEPIIRLLFSDLEPQLAGALLSTLGGSLLAALGRKGRAPNWNLDKDREARQSGWTCDASRLREELGYAPALTLDQGMQEAVEGYRREGLL